MRKIKNKCFDCEYREIAPDCLDLDMYNNCLEYVKKTKINDRCCFCDTIKGALIKLYQGWCCIRCFKRILCLDIFEKMEGIKIKDVKK